MNSYLDPRLPCFPADSVRILRDGPEIFPWMMRAIAAAQTSIDLEIYQWSSDRTGARILQALCEALRRGCKVRVVYDWFGSLSTPDSFFQPLQTLGGEVHSFHPIWATWRRKLGINQRNHRKLLILDRQRVVTGGINLADAYSNPIDRGGYHDLAIEVVGEAVGVEATTFFEQTLALVRRERRRISFRWRAPDPAVELPTGKPLVQVVGKTHLWDRWMIRRSFLAALRKAERSVEIMNPYFLPSRRFVRLLRNLVKRGIHVRVLVSDSTDAPVVDWASLRVQARLAKGGVEVFRYPGMAHGKVVVVDRTWLSVGSYNLDFQSLLNNLELVLNVLDAPSAEVLSAALDEDFRRAKPFTAESWKALPWYVRILARLFYMVRRRL